MKLITAYIKPNKLSDVTYALHEEPSVHGASLSEGRGFGSWREALSEVEREWLEINYEPHVRIEIACEDEAVDSIRRCIAKAAHTGRRGDGLVLVTELTQAYRIGADQETRFIGSKGPSAK
ncbi:MAG: P-II family nitrogen regulator [Planctomycetota bacterium]|jgi:nitrogen regulatory protein P-II 1|nr:P-II family nitrogen regulator [Planctomycetota bacterium]